MKELDKNKEYITSNLNEERRKELLNYMVDNDLGWEPFRVEDFSNGVIRWRFDEWDLAYEASASQDAIDANTLFEEIKLNKEFSYYLGDLSAEQLEEVRLEVIKENHAMVFDNPYISSDCKYLQFLITEVSGKLWALMEKPSNKEINALTLFDIPDKNSENDLNNGHELIQEAQRRGYKDDNFICLHTIRHTPDTGWEFDGKRLKLNGNVVWHVGTWAEKKEPEFKLPEKWVVRVDKAHSKSIAKWARNNIFNEKNYGWCNYGGWWTPYLPEGLKEITTEQFLQFVYPESEKCDAVRELLEEKQVSPISVFTATSAEELYNLLNNVQIRNTQLVEEASEGGEEKTEKQVFYFHNSKKHGPNFYTKEEVQYHNGEEWTEDLILYTQLGSNKKFATTKERFKKFKEVWV